MLTMAEAATANRAFLTVQMLEGLRAVEFDLSSFEERAPFETLPAAAPQDKGRVSKHALC
jgi:hypothetical protein